MTTYFITGATGFIGSHITKALLASGNKVIALKRPTSSLHALGNQASQVHWVEGDILDVMSLEEGMQEADYVVHTAAIVSFGSKKMRQQMAKVNIEGTQNVVNACIAHGGIKKLCYISSIAAIGRSPSQDWVTEKGKWEEMEDHSFYGYTKYQGELEVWRGTAEGQPAVILNPSIVLGTGNWSQSSLQLFKYGYQGTALTPEGTLNYVDVRDIAHAAQQLLHSEIENERFILSGGHILYQDFFPKLHQRFKKSVNMIAFKPWMATLAKVISGILSTFGGKPLINKETISSSRSHTKFDGRKITKAIGFQYHPLDDTLDWACDYFAKEHASS